MGDSEQGHKKLLYGISAAATLVLLGLVLRVWDSRGALDVDWRDWAKWSAMALPLWLLWWQTLRNAAVRSWMSERFVNAAALYFLSYGSLMATFKTLASEHWSWTGIGLSAVFYSLCMGLSNSHRREKGSESPK